MHRCIDGDVFVDKFKNTVSVDYSLYKIASYTHVFIIYQLISFFNDYYFSKCYDSFKNESKNQKQLIASMSKKLQKKKGCYSLKNGDSSGARTLDTLIKSQVLYQLS